MANKRMFARSVIETDAFLNMSHAAQLLYFHLSLQADDDDGFVQNPKSIMRMCTSTEENMQELLAGKFIISFESGVIVIRHWKIHNEIKKDRYHETQCQEEKRQITPDDGNIYVACPPNGKQTEPVWNQNGDNMEPTWNQNGTPDKIRLDKNSKDIYAPESAHKNKKFCKPTVEEIKSYCEEQRYSIDANKFFDHYESVGWKVGRNAMKDWQAAVRNWNRNSKNNTSPDHTCDFSNVEF